MLTTISYSNSKKRPTSPIPAEAASPQIDLLTSSGPYQALSSADSAAAILGTTTATVASQREIYYSSVLSDTYDEIDENLLVLGNAASVAASSDDLCSGSLDAHQSILTRKHVKDHVDDQQPESSSKGDPQQQAQRQAMMKSAVTQQPDEDIKNLMTDTCPADYLTTDTSPADYLTTDTSPAYLLTDDTRIANYLTNDISSAEYMTTDNTSID